MGPPGTARHGDRDGIALLETLAVHLWLLLQQCLRRPQGLEAQGTSPVSFLRGGLGVFTLPPCHGEDLRATWTIDLTILRSAIGCLLGAVLEQGGVGGVGVHPLPHPPNKIK